MLARSQRKKLFSVHELYIIITHHTEPAIFGEKNRYRRFVSLTQNKSRKKAREFNLMRFL